jgi:hypothetical protein
MADVINETLLEMHYHPALRDCFEAVFGARVLRMFKPSPQQEAWVGFDQAWVRTTYSTGEVLSDLRSAIQGVTTPQKFYVGYFLQFKLPQRMRNRSDYLPANYRTPYYRVELSLGPNKATKLSQHETLIRLAGLQKTDVNYVCAVLESADEVYDTPDIDKLVCVDVSSSPQGWATGSRHFITFQDPRGSDAQWCSEPVPATATPFSRWIESPDRAEERMNGREAADLILRAVAAVGRPDIERTLFVADEVPSIVLLPENFILFEMEADVDKA